MKFQWLLIVVVVLSLSLTGCGAMGASTPTPLPTVVLDNPGQAGTGSAATQPATAPAGDPPAENLPPRASVVTASGEAAPAQTTDIAFSAGTIVQGLSVKEGDLVQAGQVLAYQDNMAQLQSTLEANRQALLSAQKEYDQLLENVPVDRAKAQLELVQAQKALEDAEKESRSKKYQRASQETIDINRARLIQANEALSDAEAAFGSVGLRNQEDVVYAAGLTELAKARQNQVMAQYNLYYVMGLPSPLDIEETAASLNLAKMTVLQAKQAWEKVKDGDPNDQMATAIQAKITMAQANLDMAQLALDHATLRAPYNGTVVSVAVTDGQAVSPGQAIVTIADLSNLQVETTDLSERDIARVEVGQPARVEVEGLGQTFEGRVIKIAPRSTKVGGDVVYKVTIQLNEQPAGLRWGMTTTVQIGQ